MRAARDYAGQATFQGGPLVRIQYVRMPILFLRGWRFSWRRTGPILLMQKTVGAGFARWTRASCSTNMSHDVDKSSIMAPFTMTPCAASLQRPAQLLLLGTKGLTPGDRGDRPTWLGSGRETELSRTPLRLLTGEFRAVA